VACPSAAHKTATHRSLRSFQLAAKVPSAGTELLSSIDVGSDRGGRRPCRRQLLLQRDPEGREKEGSMRRREFISGLGGAAATAAWPLAGRAQETAKVPRIGVLWHGASIGEEAIYLAALRQGLRDFGYVEGKNIALDMRFPAEQYDRFFTMAAELAQLNPNVLVSAAGIAAVACHKATTTIPLVFVNVPDPVGRKLVASLNRPGGNATGLSNMAVDLTKKRVELAKEMIAGLSRVALLVNASDEVGSRAFIADGETAARHLGITVVPVGVRGRDELEGAISKISEERFQAVVVTIDGLFYVERQWIADLALMRRLPTIVPSKEMLEAGALISYGPNTPGLYRRAAYFIDKILKGAKPADLPVEQPTNFELLINLKTANTLRFEIPPTLLSRADEVIE
jgi:putative ABC transport system substrate-binding protein